MTERMTDAEVICSRMEKKPLTVPVSDPCWHRSQLGWWKRDNRPHGYWEKDINRDWQPGRPLTLDALREVEETLTEEEWRKYESLSVEWWSGGPKIMSGFRAIVHADIQQKITALAAVLREDKNG